MGRARRSRSHRDAVECDVGDVVVGTALPRVVKAEAESTSVASVQSDVFAEGAVLDVDGAVIDLHATNGEVPIRHRIIIQISLDSHSSTHSSN